MNVQVYRLWPRRPRDGSLPLGLSCDDEGLLLAGNCRLVEACLDRHGHKFYRARPARELNAILSAGHGQPVDASPIYPAVEQIAKYLTARNWTRATIAALHLRLPELLDGEAASRVLKVDALAKTINPSVFDPDKHPRWLAGSQEGHGGQFRPHDGEDLLVPAQWQSRLLQAVLRFLGRAAPRAEAPRPPSFRIPPKPKEAPAGPPEEGKPGIGHNMSPEPIEEPPAEPNQPPPLELPPEPPFPPSEITRWGRKVAEALSEAIAKSDVWLAQAVAEAADKVGWLAKEYPNIISFLRPPQTYEELTQAAQQRGRHDGYEDHHIVGQGPYNNYLDQSLVQGDANKVRIPEYKHRMINSYYDRVDPEMPELNGLTPRQFLQGKTFQEQFEFGLRVLRKFKVMK